MLEEATMRVQLPPGAQAHDESFSVLTEQQDQILRLRITHPTHPLGLSAPHTAAGQRTRLQLMHYLDAGVGFSYVQYSIQITEEDGVQLIE